MKFRKYFDEFCEQHGYTGTLDYNEKSNEYSIVISKAEDNGGIFLSKEELSLLDNTEIQNLLEFLHIGFKTNFKNK